MKKRRIIRKMLRPSLILIYLLVITIGIVVGVYAFGGINGTLLDVKAGNLEYDLSLFENINDVNIDDLKITIVEEANGEKTSRKVDLATYIEEGLAKNTDPEYTGVKKTEEELETEFYDLYTLEPGDELTRNAKYILYFNKLTTIATVYEREFDEFGNDIPVEKLNKYYTTAVPGKESTSANIELSYINDKTGKAANTSLNSVTGSTSYVNTLTNEVEKHYSLRYTDKGVQVAYQIGKFDAGESYFPQYMYATMYKPDKGAFVTNDGEFGEEQEKAYNEHVETWVAYMNQLGLENPMEASYEEVMAALSVTFEELFRGNCKVNTVKRNVGGKTAIVFSGSMQVYTREAFEYIKELIDNGTITAEYDEDDVENGTDKDGKTRNLFWRITNIDTSFFTEGEGVYFNCPDSPLTINLSLAGQAYTELSEIGYKIYSPYNDEILYPFYEAQDLRQVVQLHIYNLLYNEMQFVDYISGEAFVNADGDPLIQGGMFEFDEDGYRVYDENGVAKTTSMTLEKAADFNSIFAVESSSSLPIFAMVLDFTLSDKGLEVTLLGDSLVDHSNVSEEKDVPVDAFGNTLGSYNKQYSYSDINVLPYMTYIDNSILEEAGKEKETGMIVVPDGSGAIINFNNGKSNMLATAVNTTYYGGDMTYTDTYAAEETMDLMLGMYGFIYTTESNPRGVLAVLEKGGNQVSLFANTNDREARAYFSCKVKESKDVRIGSSALANPFVKWSKNICDTDFKFNYIFLNENEADYVSLANRYREYLIERDGLTVKDDTDNVVVDLNFLGAFEKYALFLGFKYKTPDHLTTFEQASEIIDELSTGVTVGQNTLKVNEFNVSYTGWTTEEMEYQVGGSVKVAPTLGGKKGMQEFSSYLDSKGIDFYPEVYVATTLGYDLSFGNLKYSTRNIANETTVRYQFDLATQRVDKTLAATYVVRPDYYSTIANTVINKIDKLNVTKNNTNDKTSGYYLVDLGNMTACHFSKDEEIYGEAAIQYQKDTLAQIANSNKVKIKAPYDYALQYADFITDVPITSTQRQIYDETIPFYQLVIGGLIDYTVETINGTNSKGAAWYYAKALETGSNLSFQISYQNPAILLDTDYTYFYQSYYNNWRENIVTMASNIDALGIHNGRLVYHKNVAKNIAHVKYLLNDGTYVEMYVNTTVSDYNYQGTIIPAYSYVKIA